MYLPIDSNYSGFQFIHFDLKYGYGIQCKFKFHTKDGKEVFDITHSRRVLDTDQGPAYQAVGKMEMIKITDPDKNYGYQLAVNLPARDIDINELRKDVIDCSYIKKASNRNDLNRENIIDIHIEENDQIPTSFIDPESDSKFVGIKTKHGSGVCLCYIV
jgi:hypothetical protein